MARKAKPEKVDSKWKDLLERARKEFKVDAEADETNRRLAREDLLFLHEPGAQWDPLVKQERGKRPMMEFNKLRITVKRVVNDMRANRPAGKVRAVEDGDVKTAEIYEGLVRNIWNVSDGDTVIDHAAEYQVGGGMGAWRVTTEYSHDEAFEQDICIERIRNPFCLYWDATATDPLKRDARHWFLENRIPKEEYEETYKGREVVDFESNQFDNADLWVDEQTVRVCEYWYKEPVTKRIALAADGKTLDVTDWPPEMVKAGQESQQLLKIREVKTHKIMTCIIGGGDSMLSEPVEWAGSMFPFVVVFGEDIYLDGRERWFGLTRFAKDAQRAYNYSRTGMLESVSLAPQAKFIATADQMKGHASEWAEAHKQNFPYLIYNADPKAPGPPQRLAPADIPMALVQEAQVSSDDIKAVTGIFDASLGKQANEASGVAIARRAQQGEIANFNFQDNLSKGVAHTWRLCIDLIPKIYDTPRAVRILGSDGAEDYAKINQPDPMTGQVEHDMSVGKYDVTVTTGPSFSTMRQEAAETYSQLAQGNPALFAVAGDLIMKATDLPYAQEISERIKATLPPPIQQLINKDKPMPPEVQQAMMQVDQAMQQVQQQGMMVQQAAEEAKQEVDQATKAKQDALAVHNEIDNKIASLKLEEEKLKTQVANFKTMVAETQLQFAQQAEAQSAEADAAIQADKEDMGNQVAQALAEIQAHNLQFMQDASQIMQQIQASQSAPKPTPIRMISRPGPNGSRIHEPIFAEQQAAN